MKDLRNIVLFVLCVALIPFLTDSGVVLNFVMMSLYACLLAQAWNVLGGFGGQFSFGHALFFGVGAYIQVIAQVQGGWNPWLALPVAMLVSAAVGAFVGALSFRYGLKGSYFAGDLGIRRSVSHSGFVGVVHRSGRGLDVAVE